MGSLQVYTIERYTSDNLDKKIVDKIKEDYNNYFISGMEKVDQPSTGVVFIVHLEDKNTLKTIRVTHEGTELVQDFVKG